MKEININHIYVKTLFASIHINNFMSSSGSGTVFNYGYGFGSDFLTSYGSGYGSGSTSQKVTVPTVPVPVPVPQHWKHTIPEILEKSLYYLYLSISIGLDR